MTGKQSVSSSPDSMRGYIEGYYGRLLDWQDRRRIVDRMSSHGMSSYLYAPKEDPCHRVEWRTPWPDDWLRDFAAFCDHARDRQIDIIAGIAPGLDYTSPGHPSARHPSASHPSAGHPSGDMAGDFGHLIEKADSLARAGAAGIVLMFDDIDPVSEDPETVTAEMMFHADVATQLASHMDIPVLFVPRIYADEISRHAASAYAGLSDALPGDMPVFHCGSHIVAGADPLAQTNTPAALSFRQPLILWDNFFCNDYCPRRLFIGPHAGRRGIADLMLNGTGMIETDLLLLDVMEAGESKAAWRAALTANGVPDDIHHLAPWFGAPVMANQIARGHEEDLTATPATFDAIEKLLWRWKTPLAREWYPFIFGLKHDLLMAAGDLPTLRIMKTQTPALSGMVSGEPAARIRKDPSE